MPANLRAYAITTQPHNPLTEKSTKAKKHNPSHYFTHTMDFSKYSACISQCDPPDGGATLDGINGAGTEYMVQAFYAGWSFPDASVFTTAQWQDVKKSLDLGLVGALREGKTLKQVGDDMIGELDELKGHLEQLTKETPPNAGGKWFGEVGSGLLEERIGMDIGMAKACWYANVHCLLKMGRIEDDNDNGWAIIPAFMARMLSGMVAK